LSQSQAFFDNSIPEAIADASVRVIRDDGEIFTFDFDDDLDLYRWSADNARLGEVGDGFILEISIGSEVYTANSTILRVPDIDSIGVEFRENEVFSEDGLYTEFFARDFVGRGDSYWIRTFKNGNLLDKAQELNIAFDAGFDGGSGIDGLIFIPPIRDLSNELDDDSLPLPWEIDEEIRVEIHSISNSAFNFLEIARDQISNGDNGLFSVPQANTRTNITGTDDLDILGFFNVAGVSVSTKIITE